MGRVISRLERWQNWRAASQKVAQLKNRLYRSKKHGSSALLVPHEDLAHILKLATRQIELEKPDDL